MSGAYDHAISSTVFSVLANKISLYILFLCCSTFEFMLSFFLIGRYLRAVAYREFSRLVYGYLGKRRVPLPACAYTAIRETFPTEEDDLSAGFQLGEFD